MSLDNRKDEKGWIIIISGLSGSGKTTALTSLEDREFFCIDNLPVMLLPRFLSLHDQTSSDYLKLAVVMDAREKNFVANFEQVFSDISSDDYKLEIIFLEAANDSLIRNYSYSRRPHPLAPEGKILEGIEKERQIMSPVRAAASHLVDTTEFTARNLRDHIIQKFGGNRQEMPIEIQSFGFRFGLPREADIVMDVRFLNNPYYVEELKALSGQDKKVSEYILKDEKSRSFIEKFMDMLTELIPSYEKEGKSYLTIAVGCTGGQHRSVAIAEELARLLKPMDFCVTVRHRNIVTNRALAEKKF